MEEHKIWRDEVVVPELANHLGIEHYVMLALAMARKMEEST